MYHQNDLSAEIARAIPALHDTLHTPACEQSIFRQVDALAHYVADKACDNELRSVKRALCLADKLYCGGNSAVKAAIENVFVFSLSGVLARPRADRQRLLALIPVTLFTLYVNQIAHRGC